MLVERGRPARADQPGGAIDAAPAASRRRPALPRGRAPARHRRAARDGARAARRRRRWKCSSIADARRVFIAHVVPVARERGGGAVLVLHDITDLRRADQVRRDFVANVSHELRTPLTAIRGYVEALADAPPPDEARRFLEIIARHSLRMERLVRDLLRLARLDAGQETLERVGVQRSPRSSAASSTTCEASIAARGQRIELHAGRRTRPSCRATRPSCTTCCAICRERQQLQPGRRHDRRSRARRDGDGVAITVADRGPGIPAADLPRIFERFYRVDRSRTRDPGGTGLGLSIVRHLVELHGGRVSAANREGGGAVFTIRLPAVAGDAAAMSPGARGLHLGHVRLCSRHLARRRRSSSATRSKAAGARAYARPSAPPARNLCQALAAGFGLALIVRRAPMLCGRRAGRGRAVSRLARRAESVADVGAACRGPPVERRRRTSPAGGTALRQGLLANIFNPSIVHVLSGRRAVVPAARTPRPAIFALLRRDPHLDRVLLPLRVGRRVRSICACCSSSRVFARTRRRRDGHGAPVARRARMAAEAILTPSRYLHQRRR